MAFFGKLGNIAKQVASRQINVELSASQPSLYQALRYMSSSKVFVGGLSYGTDQQGLSEAFAKYGEVIEARVIMDRETGRSRGFGFVTYTSNEEASSAIQALDGQDLHGRRIRVNYATDRQPRTGGYMGGNYGPGGGYGGGGYGGSNTGYGGAGYGAGGNYGGGYGAGGGGEGSFGNNAPSGGYGNVGGYGNNSAPNDGFSSGGSFGGSATSGGYGNVGGYENNNAPNGGFPSGGNFGGNYAAGGNYGGSTSDFGVAGGTGGSDNYVGGAGTGSNLSSGGWDFSGGNQVDGGDGNKMNEPAEGFDQDEQLNGNFKDDDEDPDTNYAKRA